MYEEYFNFSAAPFRLNPDPKFFFGSRSHNKAMAYLHYGLRQAEGFIVITGEIGAGKSMLIGHLIDQLDRSNVVAAHLLTTNVESSALLSHILSAFRIEPSGAGKTAEMEAFEDFLFDQMNRGRRVLLIVDEAQNLPFKTIEELRMLSNMDYDGTPLFQVFLVGQPEFRAVLAKPDMEQFRQRVIASYHLEPLGLDETADYIRHRLHLVGWTTRPSISKDAYEEIYQFTDGVPRKINKLCNRLFLYCSIEKIEAIDAGVVASVVKDLEEESLEQAEETSGELAVGRGEHAPEENVAIEAQDIVEEKRAAVGEEWASLAEKGKGKSAPVVIPFGTIRKLGSGGKKQDAAEEAASAAPASVSSADGASRDEGAEPDKASVVAASVFDRVRARRKAEAGASEERRERAPATLMDVANAIAAVTAASEAGQGEWEADLLEDEVSLVEAGGGDRANALVKSVNETREELKAAHFAVERLRRQMSTALEADGKRRAEITTGLERAEALIAALRAGRR